MKKFFCLLAAAAMLFASCEGMLDVEESSSESGTGIVKISVTDEISRTLEPDLSMDLSYVDFTLTGPNGECEEGRLSEDETSLSFSGLRYGSWAVSGKAYNDEDALIGAGSSDCDVHSGETTSVTLVLSPLEGEGSLELQMSWDPADVEKPVLISTLMDCGGNKTDLDFILDETEGTASLSETLEKGYYSLSLAFYDNDYLCLGAMEIVRIISGETTEGNFDFTDLKVNGGTIDVDIDVSLENPLTPVIGNKAELIGTSEPLILTASVEEDLEGVSYVWYVDGQSTSMGETFSFISDQTGPYRVDLAAFSADGSRAGSSGFTLTVSDQVQSYMRISEIQGPSHISPYAGETVENVLGVITAVENYGFWMQSPAGDDNDLTSEGIYVYEKYHTHDTGDLVLVDGTVSEYGYDGSLKMTELTYVTVETLQTGYTLPEAVVIGLDGILPPEDYICSDSVYDGEFNPDEDAIDWYESLESMLVEIDNPVAVGGAKYGEIPVRPRGVTYESATERGGLYISEDYYNPQRLHIDTDAYTLGREAMEADLGDYFDEPVKGVVSYNYGKFLILPTYLPEIISDSIERETSGLANGKDNLTVATFNMENYPRDDEEMSEAEISDKVEDIAETIVTGLNSPDILGLQEMTDDSYSEDDGTVTAQSNAARLIEAIIASGGPAYEYLDIEPADKQDGGWEEANIRVAFLYNPERVSFTPRGDAGTDDETEVVVENGEAGLTLNPGRFSQDSFENSRKSLIAQFAFNGESVFIINNHLCSKGGDDYLFGENQPPVLASEEERLVQAAAVGEMVDSLLAADSDARIVVLGDMNDFQFSAPLETLKDSGLASLTESLLPAQEQYSYVYYGNSQQLDHILVSPALLTDAQVDIVHRYAEYDSVARHTDHDPVLSVLNVSSDISSDEGTLFFSEYAEGSSNNKYVEIYNGSSETLSMEGYEVIRYNNGSIEPSGTYGLAGELAAGELYVIINSSADATIVTSGDTTLTGVTWYNGDDCLQLVDSSGNIIDQIGILGEDPGSAWDVAGITGGTAEHTLVRKADVICGNKGDWASSAGTDADDSEWIVYEQNYWENLGIHSVE